MLVAVLLAVLLAGDQPVPDGPVQTLPPGRPVEGLLAPAPAPSPAPKLRRGPPASLDLGIGWASVRQYDPFGRAGVTSFTATGPSVDAQLRGRSWYAQFTGQLLRSSIRDRTIGAAVHQDLFSVGPVHVGWGLEAAEVRFRREDFRADDFSVGTSRLARLGLGAVSLGLGSYSGTNLRVTALAGMYENRYGSVVQLPSFAGDEPLADDEVPIAGGRVALNGLVIADRVELGGSVRYLRLNRAHAPSVPDEELSGTASVTIRLLQVRRRSLYIGAVARFGPAGPGLITDKTFGLRGIWRLM